MKVDPATVMRVALGGAGTALGESSKAESVGLTLAKVKVEMAAGGLGKMVEMVVLPA